MLPVDREHGEETKPLFVPDPHLEQSPVADSPQQHSGETTGLQEDVAMVDVTDTRYTLDATSSTVTLKRRLYTQVEFDDVYKEPPETKSIKDYIRSACSCSKVKVISGLLSALPIINVIRRYRPKQYIMGDVLGGLSAAFLHLPQGLGFGLLASLTPVYGLYSTFFPLILYVIFGTSPHISFGTNAVISILTANIVNREEEAILAHANNGTEMTESEMLNYKVGIAMAAAFLSGLILLVMGVLRFGFITTYLSVSFIGGFTTASAVHIATSQVNKMLGIKIKVHSGPGKIILTYVDIFKNIPQTNPGDIITALLCLAILLGVKIGINEKFAKKLKMPVPIDLLLVIIGTMISHFAELNRRFGIAVVGDIPIGMPVPTIPTLEVLPRIGSDCFVIAIIIFAMAIAMAKLMARLNDYEIDDNQELVAYGMSNLVSSFFHCFPGTTAPPRTMILNSLKAKTTLNGIPAAIFILIVLLVAGQLFVSLPVALLAAMIVAAMKDLLLQLGHLPGIWRTSRADFVIWTMTFFVSVLVDLDYGIIAGVGVSLLVVVVHTQLASGSIQHISVKEDILVPRSKTPTSKELIGIRIFYFNSLLFFANAEKFKHEIFHRVFNPSSVQEIIKTYREHPDNNQHGPDAVIRKMSGTDTDQVHHIIIDCSAITFIDIAGVNVLKLVISKYRQVETHVFLACCCAYMWKTLNSSGFFDTFDRGHVFYDVWDAVKRAERAQFDSAESIT